MADFSRETPRGTKLIVFDFDGTIADTPALILQCVNELSAKYGYAPIEDAEKMRGKSILAMVREDLGISWWRLWRFSRELTELVRSRPQGVMLVRGMAEALQKLQQTHQTGLATSNSESFVKSVLEKEQWERMSFVRAGIPLFGKKRALQKILKEKGSSFEKIVYVGDEVRDIKACQAVGISVVAVSWGLNSKEALLAHGPDALVETPEELEKLFAEF
ncbi:MAG TPA: HAD-IA family hydrolase [Candidatus Moranbacteria bacterium]|nr:HAD-IA family hydrolase [Candidatus Moranbacteria bacterium]